MNEVFANVTVWFCVAAVVAGGIFAWWVEHRPDPDEKGDPNAHQGPIENRKEET